MLAQLPPVERGGSVVELVERRGIGAGRGRCGAGDLEPGVLGELLDGLAEAEPVELHQEADRGTVRAAAEAVVELLVRCHRERGRLLVVERAARLQALAAAFQRDARADDVDDVDAGEELVDELGRDAPGAAGSRARRGAVGHAASGRHQRGACGVSRRDAP
jgi:hypothetical protein